MLILLSAVFFITYLVHVINLIWEKDTFRQLKLRKPDFFYSSGFEGFFFQRCSGVQGMNLHKAAQSRVSPLVPPTPAGVAHPPLLCVLQCAPAHVGSEPAQTKTSVATPSAWGAARRPTTTRRAWPAATTTTRACACPPAPPTPTSLRAGAVSPGSSAPRSPPRTPASTRSSWSTTTSAWPSAPRASSATGAKGNAASVWPCSACPLWVGHSLFRGS